MANRWLFIYFLTLLHLNLSDSTNIFSLTRQEVTNTTSIERDAENDYILKINFILNENSIVPYLRDLIFENYDFYNVTTEDLIDLSTIETFDLDRSIEVLQKLNRSDIVSVENFRHLLETTNMTFNDFYEKLKNTTNLNGTPLVEALQILNVDPAKFSSALTFGLQTEVYDVLKNGTLTTEKFQSAAEKVGTDLPTFFKSVKTIILDEVKMHPISFYAEKFRNELNFDRKLYDDVWKVLQPNISDVYRVVNLRRIIDSVYNRLNENITLGVVTSEHGIMMHKKIYYEMEAVKDIVNIYAESALFPGKIYDNLTVIKTSSKNFVELWSNNSILRKIEMETKITDGSLGNCSYIFMNRSMLVEEQVRILNFSQDSAFIEAGNISKFNVGNPLICNGKLVGMASSNNKDKNLFAFDTFYQKSENNITSGFQASRGVFSVMNAILLWIFLLKMY